MCGNYITKEKIRRYLGVSSSTYGDTLLDDLIAEQMGYVDNLTATAFNSNWQKVRERHDLTKFKGGIWIGVLGIPVHVNNAPINSVTSMKIYSGSGWKEWVGTYNEGRNQDYWVEQEEGVVYINTFIFWQGGKEVQIEYSYGRTDLPKEIEELTKLLVVRNLMINERKIFALESGSEGISLETSLQYINNRILQLEERWRAVKIGHMGHVL